VAGSRVRGARVRARLGVAAQRGRVQVACRVLADARVGRVDGAGRHYRDAAWCGCEREAGREMGESVATARLGGEGAGRD
jgi:hypothetical protein